MSLSLSCLSFRKSLFFFTGSFSSVYTRFSFKYKSLHLQKKFSSKMKYLLNKKVSFLFISLVLQVGSLLAHMYCLCSKDTLCALLDKVMTSCKITGSMVIVPCIVDYNTLKSNFSLILINITIS